MHQTGAYTFDVALGDRRWVASADKCEDVLEPLIPGRYQGQFIAMDGEIDPGDSCDTQPAGGADIYFWIIVPPGKKLTATYTSNHWDAVAYLLSQCGSTSGCLAGADAEEVLTWTNSGTKERDVFLVLDAQHRWPSASFFDLDIAVE